MDTEIEFNLIRLSFKVTSSNFRMDMYEWYEAVIVNGSVLIHDETWDGVELQSAVVMQHLQLNSHDILRWDRVVRSLHLVFFCGNNGDAFIVMTNSLYGRMRRNSFENNHENDRVSNVDRLLMILNGFERCSKRTQTRTKDGGERREANGGGSVGFTRMSPSIDKILHFLSLLNLVIQWLLASVNSGIRPEPLAWRWLTLTRSHFILLRIVLFSFHSFLRL